MVELADHQKIVNVIAQALHLRHSEATDAANGITEEEHRRRHYVWVSGVLAGMQLSMDYPKLAVRAWGKVKAAEESREFTLPMVADALAQMITDNVWPITADETKLRVLADKVSDGKFNVDTGKDKAAFTDDGVLTWVEKGEREYPLETWHETWEDWADAE